MTILVTGSAGFIGAEVSKLILAEGEDVVGLDNFNDYYTPRLKRARAKVLLSHPNFRQVEADISDTEVIRNLVRDVCPKIVIHLAAQAGIRHALIDPHSYGRSNLVGFLNVIEASAQVGVNHFLYASTSSVYGLNSKTPYSEASPTQHPVSLYSATKLANESIAHSYAATYGMACTGMRFFTVYGPWGRPDMAPIKFAKAIIAGEPIQLYNEGNHSRDFTYIDDIVKAVVALTRRPAEPDASFDDRNPQSGISSVAWRVYNIGGEQPIVMRDFVAMLEKSLGRPAQIQLIARQVGDMDHTAADCSALRKITGWTAQVSLEQGLSNLVQWCESNPTLLG